MIRAKCPFCGEENDVGLMEEVRPGQPTPMMKTCVHYVFDAATKYVGVEYAEQEFDLNFNTLPAGSYGLEADLMRILKSHFKFVGPVVFAPSDKARTEARTAVEDFLRARRLVV